MNEYTLLEMIGESPDAYVQEADIFARLRRPGTSPISAVVIIAALLFVGIIVTGVYRVTTRYGDRTGYESAGGADEIAPLTESAPTDTIAGTANSVPEIVFASEGVATEEAAKEEAVGATESAAVQEEGPFATAGVNPEANTSAQAGGVADSDSEAKSNSDYSESAIALATGTVNVYYVKDGGLQTKPVTLEMTSENIFEAWKEANGIGDEVKLLSFEITSNGKESISYDGDTSVAEYSVGDYFILNVTIGAEIRAYFSNRSEALLKESLEKTFRESYPIDYDEYHLTIK